MNSVQCAELFPLQSPAEGNEAWFLRVVLGCVETLIVQSTKIPRF